PSGIMFGAFRAVKQFLRLLTPFFLGFSYLVQNTEKQAKKRCIRDFSPPINRCQFAQKNLVCRFLFPCRDGPNFAASATLQMGYGHLFSCLFATPDAARVTAKSHPSTAPNSLVPARHSLLIRCRCQRPTPNRSASATDCNPPRSPSYRRCH